MSTCRNCKYYKTDVDLPHPVCTLHQFHFTDDFTPCEDFAASASSSSSSSSSSSGNSGKGCGIGCGIVVLLAALGFLASNWEWIKNLIS